MHLQLHKNVCMYVCMYVYLAVKSDLYEFCWSVSVEFKSTSCNTIPVPGLCKWIFTYVGLFLCTQ